MADPDGPATDKSPADSKAAPTQRGLPANQSRRRLLETLTVGGSIAIAGCGLFNSDTRTTATEANPTNSQTLRIPVEQNPGRTSFYAPWAKNDLESTFAVTPKKQVDGRLRRIIREQGAWSDKRYAGGDTHYTWLEDITITPSEVTVTIRDEATWSDGRPITGSDIAVGLMDAYIINRFPPYFATGEKEEPTLAGGAIDEFTLRDKSVTYRSSPGYFDLFWDSILTDIAVLGVVPTHIEPYTTYTEAVFETARRAQQGQINPWKGWNDPLVTPDDPHKASLVEKYLSNEGKYVAKFSKPEHVVSTSAWDLVEINGPEAVFEPNFQHRNAEQINFKRLVLEYTASERRAQAALKADRLDYATPGATPQAVVEALPDTITQLQIPGGKGSGNELGLSFNHSALGNRKVRMALMYALDQSTIANNIHQSAALPVTTPGGETWNATDYVSQEWIDGNLTTYQQDRDKAASLMREAGYTKNGGQWRAADGEPLTLPLPTTNGTPQWEPTVAGQLTDFGIQTSVETLQEATFDRRKDNGEFTMWAESGLVSSIASNTLLFWYDAAVRPKVHGIYPQEQYETGDFSERGHPVPRTEERYEVFTVEAPPIGQPNGPLEEYHPSALAIAIFNHPPEAEFRRRVKKAMWLANWLLPVIPINRTLVQHFIDDAHWKWPTDTPSWQTFTNAGPRSIDGIFASGTLRAKPDNPEGGTK